VVAGLAGAVLVQPAGVYLAGYWSGANGGYWPTVLGDVVGLGAAVGVGCATLAMPSSSQDKMLPIVLITAVVLPLTGAIMGYELSTHQTSVTSSNQPMLLLSAHGVHSRLLRHDLHGWPTVRNLRQVPADSLHRGVHLRSGGHLKRSSLPSPTSASVSS
jgi:hypothetical protein